MLHMNDLGLGDPMLMAMGDGDALLMDSRLFHYGSANTSNTPRAQLSATFRSGGRNSSEDGFTYELHEDLRGRYRLGNFCEGAPPPG